MTRTQGSKDKGHRKARSDKHKRRKLYRGHLTKKKRHKKGRLNPYVPRRKRDDLIKLWFWGEEQMNPDSYRNFSKETRAYMRRVVYGKGAARIRVDVPHQYLTNKAELEAVSLQYLWVGVWLCMGFSNAKNKYQCKPVKLFKVRITEHPEGMKAKVVTLYRISRYFFWRGE